MKQVYVIGNGQLGNMLRQAGEPLGISVFPIGFYEHVEIPNNKQIIITAEIDNWPKTSSTNKLTNHVFFINRDVFPCISDRFLQKKMFNSLKLPTAKWYLFKSNKQLDYVFKNLGKNIIIKYRTGGYDGRGQFSLDEKNKTLLSHKLYEKCIIEQSIKFDIEFSIIGARDYNSKLVFYPIVFNLHKNGILQASVVFPKKRDFLQKQAENALSIIMNKFNYIGVMVMECFLIKNTFIINEISPRVHNSGHWTQNGASISQFELHLRSILNLPIYDPEVNTPSITINLIGIDINTDWLSLPLVRLHWYNKEVKPIRKVGHLNISHNDPNILISNLDKLINLLPNNYKNNIEWIKNKLLIYFFNNSKKNYHNT